MIFQITVTSLMFKSNRLSSNGIDSVQMESTQFKWNRLGSNQIDSIQIKSTRFHQIWPQIWIFIFAKINSIQAFKHDFLKLLRALVFFVTNYFFFWCCLEDQKHEKCLLIKNVQNRNKKNICSRLLNPKKLGNFKNEC
jgi:hypothetical protein